MSKLGWIHFSSRDRELVKHALAMMTEAGTLDELGIGQIRDAFSDVLFPGISTIQTRAKYFITVPRILRDFQALLPSQKRKHTSLEDYLKRQENTVAQILDKAHEENEPGIIGRTRVTSGGVDRRPSVIYWSGLRILGLVKTQLSLTDFCRQLDSSASSEALIDSALSEGSDDLDCMKDRPLVSLPDFLETWKEEGTLNLQLTRNEAEFLKGRFVETPAIASSVPAQLFNHDLVDTALLDNSNSGKTAFDLLVDVLKTSNVVDLTCQSYLKVAQEFSLAMEGPHLRYNILLNKKFTECVKKYEEEYGQWLEKVRSLNLFDEVSSSKWLKVASDGKRRSIKNSTQKFVSECCSYYRGDGSVSQLNDLVLKQAKTNKGQRSWLIRGIKEEQWLGIRRLEYRWGTAKNIIKDIQVGLNAST
ncbi:MAG: DUF6361 family protein [Desulfuromusa sp.]